jgi:hypothetical protein
MIREDQQLVTNEPIVVQNFKRITDHFRLIHRLANTRISTDYAQKYS